MTCTESWMRVLREDKELIRRSSKKWMKIFLVIQYLRSLGCSERDCHVQRISGDTKGITICIWKWWDRAKEMTKWAVWIWAWGQKVTMASLLCHRVQPWRGLHRPKWDMWECSHLTADGRMMEPWDFKKAKVSWVNMLLGQWIRLNLMRHLTLTMRQWEVLLQLKSINKTSLTNCLKTKNCLIKILMLKELNFSKNWKESKFFNNKRKMRLLNNNQCSMPSSPQLEVWELLAQVVKLSTIKFPSKSLSLEAETMTLLWMKISLAIRYQLLILRVTISKRGSSLSNQWAWWAQVD